MTEEKIGRYQIKQELGRGGMATVYLAHDPRFKRDVAIKVLPRQFTHDPTFRARFEREAQTIAHLEHPAIVPVYDFGEEDGQPYLVMRYLTGGSLADRLKDGPLPLLQSADVLQRIASALDRAHKQGVIHRDLKPGNILFDDENKAYLADFGIAKLALDTATLTGSGIIGTPAYMSPEQIKGEDIDGRSDIYTLGIILYEMLTGQQPYEAKTPMGVLYKHVHAPVPHITDKIDTFPLELDSTLSQALAKEPTDRFTTASLLAEAVTTSLQRKLPPTPAPRKPPPSPTAGLVTQLDNTLDEPFIPPPLPAPQPPAPPLAKNLAPLTPPSLPGQPVAAPQPPTRKFLPIWAWGVLGVVLIGIVVLFWPSTDNESPTTLTDHIDEQTTLVELIEEAKIARYEVTDLVYGNGVWAVTLSQDGSYQESILYSSPESPTEYIEAQWEEGYAVTGLAYGDGLWTVVLSKGSEFDRQVWHLGPESPLNYIEPMWDEGYSVTSLAYGDGRWAVVMSQGSPYERQIWHLGPESPLSYIESQWEEGYSVTSLAYGDGRWAVVMSQGSPFERQIWHLGPDSPTDYIETNWEDGYHVTDLAHGGGGWGLIMSQGSPYTRQLWYVRPELGE